MLQNPQTVLCLGDSITRGKYSYNWVADLQSQWRDWRFINAGRDGELAYNARQRLAQELERAGKLDAAIVMLGTNDVNATISDVNKERCIKKANLPRTPTLEWYAENMRAIVQEIRRTRPAARLALMSPPVLGEDPQNDSNQKLIKYRAVLESLAQEYATAYLPLHERQMAYLQATPPDRPPLPLENGIRRPIRAALRHFILRQSWDAISRAYGLRLTTDNIHLNRTGGLMAKELAESFLLAATPPDVR